MARPGQPTKYNDTMPQKLIDAMRGGKSVVQFCSDQRIHVDTHHEWKKVHSEYSEAFNMARNDCESYWETWLKNNLENRNINGALTKMLFANRFGWSDRNENVNHVVFEDIQAKALDIKKSYGKEF